MKINANSWRFMEIPHTGSEKSWLILRNSWQFMTFQDISWQFMMITNDPLKFVKKKIMKIKKKIIKIHESS